MKVWCVMEYDTDEGNCLRAIYSNPSSANGDAAARTMWEGREFEVIEMEVKP